MKKNLRKLAVLVAVMILTLSLASNGFAANTIATLKATYRNIAVFKNGVQVQFSKEPFIVDGTTYVPLRDMSEVLDKNVTWDGTTYRIGINDKPGQSTTELYQQVFNLQMQVTQLQNENTKLKEQLNKSSGNIDDLEDDLNDDYTKIGGVTVVDIVLKGDKDDVEVQINIDTTKTAQYDAWNKLDDDDFEDFLQDVVDDILDVFEDADVTGFIYDKYDKSKPVKFSISSKDKVVLGSSSSSKGDIEDLEDFLNDEYYRVRGVYFDIYLDQNKNTIDVEIEADCDDIFDYFSEAQLKIFLKDIYDDIISEFKDASVEGFVEDDYGKVYFEFSSKGVVSLDY